MCQQAETDADGRRHGHDPPEGYEVLEGERPGPEGPQRYWRALYPDGHSATRYRERRYAVRACWEHHDRHPGYRRAVELLRSMPGDHDTAETWEAWRLRRSEIIGESDG